MKELKELAQAALDGAARPEDLRRLATLALVAAEKVENQARHLGAQDAALARKNVALDALHYVWCDGGCAGGVHRYGEHPPLTEEIVAEAERNARRLRRWHVNASYRAARAGEPSS